MHPLPPSIGLRRLHTLTPEQLLDHTRLLLRAFEHDAYLSLMLGGDGTQPPSEEIMLAYMQPKARAILDDGLGGGEWWVAEHIPDQGEPEVVGMAMWFKPGFQYLGSDEQKKFVGIGGFLKLLKPEMLEWFTRYYLPRLENLCETAFGPNARRDNWQMHGLAVDPKWQGKGIGRALMEAVAFRALDEGKRVLWETVTDEDVELYKRWGAVERGSMPVDMLGGGQGKHALHAMELPAEARKASSA